MAFLFHNWNKIALKIRLVKCVDDTHLHVFDYFLWLKILHEGSNQNLMVMSLG